MRNGFDQKVVDETADVSEKSNMEGMISLTTDKQILANVSTIKIKRENLKKELTAYSYLDFVEQNRKTIPAKFNGRIEKLFVDKTGEYIKKVSRCLKFIVPTLYRHRMNF